MKKLSLKIVIGIIVTILLIQSTTVIAASKTDLNNSSSETEKKIDETKKELDGIKNEKSEVMKQVEELTGKISDYENQIKTLDASIGELNTKITEAEKNLAKAQEDYTKQEELLNARLVATYEAGDTSYLDVLLSSEGITDFISNYYLVTEIATSDMELMEKIQQQKKQIEEDKKTLETSKQELATSKATKQGIATQLSDSKNQKNAYASQLSEDEKQTQAELEQFEADKRAIQAELAAIAKKEAEEAKKNQSNNNNNNNNGGGSSGGSSGNNTPSVGGFVFPVAGLSRANINNKNFPSYAGHTGVDVNINVHGKTIVAAKAGTVQRSTAYIKNGKYYSYGECIVINHGGGLATLYAHGSPNSRRVAVGQTVTQGQAIMTVGTTGNSTGEHLHFEVLKNGIPVNPFSYLP